MNMKKLIDPTDAALNEAFAVEVAGYYVKEEFPGTDFPFTAWQGDRHLSQNRWASAKGPLEHIQSFTSSADAVLPWLEKGKHGWDSSFTEGQSLSGNYMVRFDGHIGRASTLPRAAVIALLRSKGVEIEFTL